MKNRVQFLILFFVNLISNILITNYVLAKEGAGVGAPGCRPCNQHLISKCKANQSNTCQTAAHQVINAQPEPASKESSKSKGSTGKPATK